MRSLFASFALIGIAGSLSAADVSIAEPQPYIATVDKSGNASLTLTMTNGTGMPLTLGASEFTRRPGTGTPWRSGGAVKFNPASLEAGKPTAVTIAVSGITEAGDSTADILARGVKFATVTALRIPTAYNVQLEGQNPEVVFAPGRLPEIKIVNSDATAYRFSWALATASSRLPTELPQFDIPANGTVRLDASPFKPATSLLGSGTLKDDVRDASLLLRPAAIEGAPPQPDKWLPLKVRTRYFGDLTQQTSTALFTYLLMALGAILSLWMHYFIPNTSGALKLRRQIYDMGLRLDGIGDDLAPRWSLLIEAPLATCQSDLFSMPRFYPGYADVLAHVNDRLTMYGQWLEVAYSVSAALAELRLLQQTGAPPGAISLVERKTSEALEPIASGFTKPEEIQAMQAAKTKIQQIVAALQAGQPIAELEANIKDREQRLLPDIASLKAAFPDFANLFDEIAAGAATTLTPATYLDRDTFSLQGEYLQQYRDLALREGISPFPPQAPGGPPANARERIAAKDAEFRSYVRPESYRSLQFARVFVSEMRQDFYPPVFLEELQNDKDAVELRADPVRPETGTPVHFIVRFRRGQLNEIAAIQEWSVRWKIDGVLQVETGWDLYYVFDKPGTHAVEVEFVQLSGVVVPVAAKPSLNATVTESGPRGGGTRFSPEARIEGLRLAFALAVVLAGLFSTARDKVESLGLLQAAAALVALGFTVNTAKEIVIGKPDVK